jgi:1-acyl-sn-glycerol-3-phosphate acyltransferase
MSFHWLSDADLDPHPPFTWLTACCFDLAVRAVVRNAEIIPPDFRVAPGTLVVSNHLRDCDVPVLTAVLCRRRGMRILNPLPFCAAREDLFRRGFIGDLLQTWPRPVTWMLGRVPLAGLFRILRVQPIRRIREFTFGETLAALRAAGFGATRPEDLLCARGLHELESVVGALPARLDAIDETQLAALRLAHWGLRRLRVDVLRALAPAFRATISGQIGRLVELISTGRVVYLAPEGVTSRSGRFGGVRAGAWQVYRRCAKPPPVLPVALSYDPLCRGRMRAIVAIGKTIPAIDAACRREFDARLRVEILRLSAVTCSHLASRFIAAGPRQFTTQRFSLWLRHAARAAQQGGLTVDPLLRHAGADDLADERLAWLARRALIAPAGTGWRNRWPSGVEPAWATPAGVVSYLHNALDDLATLDSGLAGKLAP